MIRNWRRLHNEELHDLYSSSNIVLYSKENEACEAYCMNREGRWIESCSGKS